MASTKAQFESLVIAELLANLPAGIAADRVRLPNAPTISSGAPFVEIAFSDLSAAPQDANGTWRTVSGMLNIDVYWQKGEGSKAPAEVAEHFRSLMTYNANIGPAGDIPAHIGQGNIRETFSESWYRLTVDFPYTYEGLTDGS